MAGVRTEQMHLAAFAAAGPVSGCHGGWRHPAADRNILDAAYYTELGRLLEASKFDMLFLPDILSIPNRHEGSHDSQLRHGALGALRLDPMIVLSIIAATTRHLGLASTLSTSYFEPYAVARAFATLDHMSAGRSAWNIVTSFQQSEAANFGRTEQLSRDERYDRAEEFVEVTCKLWDSWRDDALVRDPVTPLYARPEGVSAIDHEGKWFNVRGPLNVSRPPQGRPVFIQAGASGRGRDFAAKWADVIFVTHSSLESAKAFYAEMKERTQRFGRDPQSLKILPGIVPIVGETQTIALEQERLLSDLTESQAGLSTLSYHLDTDLATFPQDQVLPEMEVSGVQGHYKEVSELTRKSGIGLQELGHRYGMGPLRDFIGSADAVSANMQRWYQDNACDGFMIQVPYLPGGLESFARLVIPQLQEAGLFRREYSGSTLRDHLGLQRPAN